MLVALEHWLFLPHFTSPKMVTKIHTVRLIFCSLHNKRNMKKSHEHSWSQITVFTLYILHTHALYRYSCSGWFPSVTENTFIKTYLQNPKHQRTKMIRCKNKKIQALNKYFRNARPHYMYHPLHCIWTVWSQGFSWLSLIATLSEP